MFKEILHGNSGNGFVNALVKSYKVLHDPWGLWMSADIFSYLRESDMRYHMCRQRDFRHVCHLKTGGAYV